MDIVSELERLFPGRGAVAANVLRNQGIWIEPEPLYAHEPPSAPVEDVHDLAVVEGGDV